MAKLIALSFDDGPNTTTTVEVLDMLAKHEVVASFFVVGERITPESAEVMKCVVAQGCEIENHSYTHDVLKEKTSEELTFEVGETSRLIEEAVGRTPVFFRPPYIAVDENMWENISLPFICGYGADDWLPEVSAAERAKRIIDGAKDGAIILLHDMEGNDMTVEALDTIIPTLKAQGYEFVTVAQLFEAKGIAPERHRLYTYLV